MPDGLPARGSPLLLAGLAMPPAVGMVLVGVSRGCGAGGAGDTGTMDAPVPPAHWHPTCCNVVKLAEVVIRQGGSVLLASQHMKPCLAVRL